MRTQLLAIAVLGLFFGQPLWAQINDEIPQPLKNAQGQSLVGDAGRGAYIIQHPDKASCLLCHRIQPLNLPFQGTIGPDLSTVGSRYTAAQLRFRLMNPQAINPNSPMPSYWRRQGFNQIDPKYQGASVYSAQELEDVISYLLTLTTTYDSND